MTTDVRTFQDLGVDDAVVRALADADIVSPFPIQELSLPMALAGADLIGQARTGTGKTLAFGIPLVQRLDPQADHTQALVVVPTRELCLQVHDDLTMAGATRGVKVVAAYGGRAIDPQSEAIAAGAPIVVGTPGRLLDLCRRRLLDLSRCTALVLDEADEMLDMGFLPDVEQLIERCPTQRQTLLFSATMPSEVVKLARRYMDKPTFMRTEVEQQQHVAPETRQHFFACHRLDKPAVVARILAAPGRGRTLIFTRTKRMADVLASELRDRGIDAGVIHSDLRQEARERALAKFRKGRIDVLCATEVAARGLDIDEVTHVINYDCPDDERMYLHRIGRTGRAGAAGIAVTLAVWNELARLDMIKKALDIDQPTHEVLSTTPMLDDLFGPAEVAGRQPAAERTGRDRRRRDDTGSGDDAPRGSSRAGRGDGGRRADKASSGPASRPEPRPRTRQRRQRRRTQTSSSATASTTAKPETGAGKHHHDAKDRVAVTAGDVTGEETTGDGSQRGQATGAAPTRTANTPDDVITATAAPTRTANTPDDVIAATAAPTRTANTPDDDVAATSATPTAEDSPSDQPARDGRSPRRSRGRRRRSSRGRRRSGRPDARRPAEEREEAPQMEGPTSRADHTRGDGRPALHRPLRITHLP
ncbi:MAG TPA: DEAD/DEAH box helicase [Euzebyales bacterium]